MSTTLSQKRYEINLSTVRWIRNDTRYLVPYSLYLSLKFNSHINGDVVATMQSAHRESQKVQLDPYSFKLSFHELKIFICQKTISVYFLSFK